MKKIILGFMLGGIVFTLGGVVASTMISSKNVTYQNKTVNNALDELYNEAITGKELVAAAITNKGITTTSNDTYETMATNINSIDTNHTEINQKISNLESKHNTDIASLTGSISNLSQNLTNSIMKYPYERASDVNLLLVDLTSAKSIYNVPSQWGGDASKLINSPITSGSFIFQRYVHYFEKNRVMVELVEFYPVQGRRWANHYNYNNWTGWTNSQSGTFIDVGTVLKGNTIIAAGETVTYMATRDCFVDVSAYAYGNGQNTKIYIDNICIYNPYMNNSENAGLMISNEIVPLKSGQTIKIVNGTYTTSAYTVFSSF